MSGPLPNLDDLEAEWAEFMHDRPGPRKGWSQDQKWRADNPGKLAQLLTYRDGGPRPDFLGSQPGAPERRMVEHLDAWHEARFEEPPPPPSGDLGADLPAGLPEPTGNVVTVTTDAQLRSAIDAAVPNQRIVIPDGVTVAGSGDIYFRSVGHVDAPVLYDIQGALTGYSSVYLTGQNLIVRGEIHRVRAVRPTTTGRFIVLDKCHIHDCVSQGVLTSSGVGVWQITNTLIERCGEEANFDHNIYAATAVPGCLIANCLLRDAWAYNLQLYPAPNDLIVTCVTIDGGQIQPDNRGGIVLGGDSGGGPVRNKLVGIVSTRAPYNGVIRINQPLGAGNEMFDSVGWANSDNDYEPDPGIRYENCITVPDSPYVNVAAGDYRPRPGGPLVGHIRPERFGLVPPLDMNGRPRVIRPNGGVDAGALAAA